jgi:hypothetical protein
VLAEECRLPHCGGSSEDVNDRTFTWLPQCGQSAVSMRGRCRYQSSRQAARFHSCWVPNPLPPPCMDGSRLRQACTQRTEGRTVVSVWWKRCAVSSAWTVPGVGKQTICAAPLCCYFYAACPNTNPTKSPNNLRGSAPHRQVRDERAISIGLGKYARQVRDEGAISIGLGKYAGQVRDEGAGLSARLLAARAASFSPFPP